MPAETKRKILKQGASGVMVIPADYRRYHKLTPGTSVKILYDSLLLVIPPDAEKKLEERGDLVRRLLE
jgi:antitoxin component of MazEF toxin-antitoxin module